MTRISVGLWVVLICGLSACGHRPATDVQPMVRTIHISDVVQPEVLYTTSGEEVRWKNLRSNPVRLGFLTMRLLDELACEKGVATIFGQINDLVTIPPGESISLCIVRAGELQYNVWFDEKNPKGTISRTATVRVEKRG
ncbi:MAG: hypothetical protein KJS98_08170 [Nitrospirae bacterium]|nr:hypothetical protein [Nitrospirota bacterium]MDE3050143.1 hypothetical protein [Nitrospirota bacterium]MDE3221293.1 hypothetical protein [Nitrospirota bacterium]